MNASVAQGVRLLMLLGLTLCLLCYDSPTWVGFVIYRLFYRALSSIPSSGIDALIGFHGRMYESRFQAKEVTVSEERKTQVWCHIRNRHNNVLDRQDFEVIA
jgi:hypothetical protein